MTWNTLERVTNIEIRCWEGCDHPDGYATLTHDGADIYLRHWPEMLEDGRAELGIQPEAAVALGEALISMGNAMRRYSK